MLAAVDILQYDGVIPKTFVAQLQPTSQTGSGNVLVYDRSEQIQEEKRQPCGKDDDLAACIARGSAAAAAQQKQPQIVPQVITGPPMLTPPMLTPQMVPPPMLPPRAQRRRKHYGGESFEESQHELTIQQSEYETQQTVQEGTFYEEYVSTNERVDGGRSERSGW